MRPEDLQVDQVLYSATMEVPPGDGPEFVMVREFIVKMVGKSRFRMIGSKSGSYAGTFAANRSFLRRLETSPAQAVKNLEERIRSNVDEIRKQHEIAVIRAGESLQAVQEWRSKSGL